MEINKYNDSKIYKLISNYTNKIYIGSTCEKRLCQRLARHKDSYIQWIKNNKLYVSSFELFKLGNVEIVLLESINCNSRDELLKKEREYIEKYKDIIINKILRPITTNEELKEKRKEYIETNKEKLKEQRKEYYEANKEKIKEYYEANKEANKEQRKEYYEANKEEKKEIIICECDKKYTLANKARHLKSSLHKRWQEAKKIKNA